MDRRVMASSQKRVGTLIPEQALIAALGDLHVQAGRPSAREIARKLGTVSHTTVAEALSGRRVPSWPVVASIVAALGGDEEPVRKIWADAEYRKKALAVSDADAARTVFVITGPDELARSALFDFLRALYLRPMEWEALLSTTGKTAPTILTAIRTGIEMAQAVVVFVAPSDVALVRNQEQPEDENQQQPSPNVLIELGMALMARPDRTIIVTTGDLPPVTDLAGMNFIRLDGSAISLQKLAQRLKAAGCLVDSSGRDWLRMTNRFADLHESRSIRERVFAAEHPDTRTARDNLTYWTREAGGHAASRGPVAEPPSNVRHARPSDEWLARVSVISTEINTASDVIPLFGAVTRIEVIGPLRKFADELDRSCAAAFRLVREADSPIKFCQILEQDLAQDPSHDLDNAIDRTLTIADQYMSYAEALYIALSLAEGQANGLQAYADLARKLNFTHANDLARDLPRARDLALLLQRAADLIIRYDRDHPNPVRDFFHDRQRIRDLKRGLYLSRTRSIERNAASDHAAMRALVRDLSLDTQHIRDTSQILGHSLTAATRNVRLAAQDFRGADLSATRLERVNLIGIQWDRTTYWPSELVESIERASEEISKGIFVILPEQSSTSMPDPQAV